MALGLLFWILVMSLEYVLWLGQQGRLFLFIAFVGVELLLLVRFIFIPISYLVGLRKGISNKEASRLISSHFPDVSDKLYNLLELSENREKSELLMASIDQRSDDLKGIPFKQAVSFKEALRYGKYLVIPVVILIAFWISGSISDFLNSNQRIVNYDVAFERPAPFKFVLLNDDLDVLDNEPFEVKVGINGEVRPEDVFLIVEGERVLMKMEDGIYSHGFQAPVGNLSFYFMANGWKSRSYSVTTNATPRLNEFKMEFKYPSYLGKRDEVIFGTGNAVVPEGTKVEWKIKTANTGGINIAYQDSVRFFKRDGDEFSFGERLMNDLDYKISTSNKNVTNFENLGYTLEVIRDEFPTLEVSRTKDSVNPNLSFFSGLASDDHLVNLVSLVAYPVDDVESVQRVDLVKPRSGVHQFYYTFPSGLDLEEGKDYDLYFEVVDNDGVRGGKRVRSRVFRQGVLDDNQLKDNKLEFQNDLLEQFDRSLEKYQEQKNEISKMSKAQNEEGKSGFDKKNEIKDFLRKQKEQERMMEAFTKQLKESLDKQDEGESDKMLKERLERQELEARRNKKLLEELNKLADRLDKEELKKRLEEVAKKQSSSARNLEQILELTKRYYVTEKMRQLSGELEKLAKQQLELSTKKEGENMDKELQERLNKKFEELSEELEELRKDNAGLRKPMQLDIEARDEQSVKQKQGEVLEGIAESKKDAGAESKQQNNDKAGEVGKKQKAAGQKIQEMSESLKQGASAGGGSEITEDAEMLRQILDNLVTFSFKQESLFESVEGADVDFAQFSETVRKQKELRGLFEHVDDSLFALSLRRAELSEFVNEQITEVYYNIDKSLESIAENQIFQGASYQQYVVNATNSLADFLANILDNMQQSMKPGQGQGQGGSDFQLPDIISGQKGIGDKMQGTGSSGQGSSGNEGKGKDGKGNEPGQNGSEEGEGRTGNENGKKGGSDIKGNGNGGSDGRSGEEGFGQEMELSKVYEIYKEQQLIREQLEKQLEDMIKGSDKDLAKKILRQMQDFENDLLENGITERTRSKVNRIQHELLKLENAALQQGNKEERKSTTNLDSFENPILTKPDVLKNGAGNIEILNRQALPLRQNFEKKVKVYFKND